MVTDELWKRAGLLGLDLRRNSVILPLSDLVIAAVAIHHGMEVYSTDPHFQQIPGLRLFAG
jgi:predicted nucleic acid-binding protein